MARQTMVFTFLRPGGLAAWWISVTTAVGCSPAVHPADTGAQLVKGTAGIVSPAGWWMSISPTGDLLMFSRSLSAPDDGDEPMDRLHGRSAPDDAVDVLASYVIHVLSFTGPPELWLVSRVDGDAAARSMGGPVYGVTWASSGTRLLGASRIQGMRQLAIYRWLTPINR